MPKRGVRLSHDEFIPLNNKARQYVNTQSGEVVSKYAFRKVAKREEYTPKTPPRPSKSLKQKYVGGGEGASVTGKSGTKYIGKIQIKPVNPKERYNKIIDKYAKNTNENNKLFGLPPLSRGEVIRSPRFQELYRDYKNSKDREKGGKRHQALIIFGILDEEDDYY